MNFQNTAHVPLFNAHCAAFIKGLHSHIEENLEKPVKVGTGWTIWGSNPRRGERFFSSEKRLDWLWVPPNLLLNRSQHSLKGKMWLRHHILLLFQHVVLGELFYAVVLEPIDYKFSCFCRGLFEDSGLHECDTLSSGEWVAMDVPQERIAFIHSFIHLFIIPMIQQNGYRTCH